MNDFYDKVLKDAGKLFRVYSYHCRVCDTYFTRQEVCCGTECGHVEDTPTPADNYIVTRLKAKRIELTAVLNLIDDYITRHS